MKKLSLLSTIQKASYRITEPRKKICSYIDSHTGVFCANDILASFPEIDKTVVYRTLDMLENEQLITPLIRLDGQQFYEVFESNKKGHHHHVICRSCKKTDCISCHITIPKITKFSQLIHSSVFTGICHSCN